jgi:FtsP/CotA-like multicopper oxidase with cupredoxin domain
LSDRNAASGLTRRGFLLASAGAALAAGVGGYQFPSARAGEPASRIAAVTRSLDVDGRAAGMLGLALPGGQPVFRATMGQRFAAVLENRLAEPTLIHWHGLTPPADQDGTPGLSQAPLAPGASYAYDFPLRRAGTFWMHSHVGLQRQKLLAAPLIVADPADAARDEQEVVLMLHDFTFRDPAEILAGLTKGRGPMAGMDHMHHAAAGAPAMDHGAMPMHGGAMQAGAMGHAAMDLNDIAFDAFLANDRTLADPAVIRVEPAGRIRLRVINAGASTNFWLDLGALEGELVAVDGDPVEPLRGRRFPLAMAQRIDLRLTLPKGEGAYPVLALREGAVERTGIVLATARAAIARLSGSGSAAGALDFAMERRLRAARPLAARRADRVLTLDLTGDMMAYDWRVAPDRPLPARRGERVEIVMRNRSSMSHPMHLHGHHFQVVALDGTRFPGALRDTVLVPAGASVTIALDADNPGRWAFHCHNLYHMAAGLMTALEYEA